MIKNLLIACMTLLLVACSSKNEQYYRTNPQALQDALRACPVKKPSKISCDKLSDIALSVNELAYQLQTNPQGFGRKILALQEKLAVAKAKLKSNPQQSELKTIINDNKQQLAECMAVVRWLESPES